MPFCWGVCAEVLVWRISLPCKFAFHPYIVWKTLQYYCLLIGGVLTAAIGPQLVDSIGFAV